MTSRMISRSGLCVLAATLATLATAARAQAALYLQLGTLNTSNAQTSLKGDTGAPELYVMNTNGDYAGIKAESAGGYAAALYGLHSSSAGTGAAVQGISVSTAANAFSVYGLLTSTTAQTGSAAVRGQNSATNSNGYGVWGSHAGGGVGVYATSVTGNAVQGVHTGGGTGQAIRGVSASKAPNASAVYGLLSSTSPGAESAAVRGDNAGTSAAGYGVVGSHAGYGTGVYGTSLFGNGMVAVTSSGTGISATAQTGVGVEARHYAPTGDLPAVMASTSSSAANATAVKAWVAPAAAGLESAGLSGINYATTCCSRYGVRGAGPTGVYGSGVRGVAGESTDAGTGVHIGVYGHSSNGYGIAGSSSTGLAGYFAGNVTVVGALSKTAGSFRIDHPLDPAHKYLQHSFVESPDMKDVYDGVVTTDDRGFATVRMPRWFQALNRSFRYQLTIVGARGWNARVLREISSNRFTIQTDRPGVKVSWQVTGIRHDPYANEHRIQVEVRKPAAEQGKYIYPQGYGKTRSLSVGTLPESRRSGRDERGER